MYLVLCSNEDQSAQWAFQGLRKLGVEPIELVTSEQLAFSRSWEHRVGQQTPSVNIVLADGRTISSSQIKGVLNRLLSPPDQLIKFAQAGDRDYATQELTSFYLSWLAALPGVVINRAQPQGFCGRWRHTSEWALIAQRAGLPAPAYKQTPADHANAGYQSLAPAGSPVQNVVALHGRVFGTALPGNIQAACLRFAALAQCQLLGISLFESKPGDWQFCSATPYPDFTSGGDELINYLANTFRTMAQETPQ